MSSDQVALSLRGVSKCYTLFEKPGDRLKQFILPSLDRALGREPRVFHRPFWALRDVSLDVRKGSTVGILGRNGTGKSTLLQIIAGTLEPTSGEVAVAGRVAALLELGSGFHPEFTGRENVMLNAAVLGMARGEVEAKFDAIAAFADLGPHLDQPVRSYSSGMLMRLAFSVAISVEPDLLIVDEALAVGDEAFQRKCYARLDALKQRGTTILFVSHSASSILELCDHAILLDAGEKLVSGHPKPVVEAYHRLLYAPEEKRAQIRDSLRGRTLDALEDPRSPTPAPADGFETGHARTLAGRIERWDEGLVPASTSEFPERGARIGNAALLNARGERVNVLVSGEDYTYAYDVTFSAQAHGVLFGMLLKSMTGVELFGMASHPRGEGIATVPAGTVQRVEFRFSSRLLPGVYFLNAGCMGILPDGEFGFFHRVMDAVMFRVELPASDRMYSGYFDLSAEPACRWRTLPPTD